jgi:protein gp37
MGIGTGIEWTDSTWSPIRFRVKADAAQIARAKGYTSLVAIAEKMAGHVGSHCEHVSPGCEHCYAATNNHRCLPANGTGLPYDRRSRDLVEAFVDEKILLQPLRWKSVWQDLGNGDAELRSRRIFVENQSDLYGEWVTDEMLDRVKAVMALCPQHTFQVLTKRPERMREYLNAADVRRRIAREANIFMRSGGRAAHSDALVHTFTWGSLEHAEVGEYANYLAGITDRRWPLPNVWLGVSVENQAAADVRIPLLLQTPAAVRFISAEPLLGALDLTIGGFLGGHFDRECDGTEDGCTCECFAPLDWVIAGGESGPGARPMHPDWARSLRDQCVAAKVPFFFKQHGEWISLVDYDPFIHGADTGKYPHQFSWRTGEENDAELPISCFRVSKKAAGALLDGRAWKQFPEARP